MTNGLARKLSRTKAHRTALLKNLVSDLFQHGTIISTHEKCMEAKNFAERVITMCNKDLKQMNNVDAVNDTPYRRNIQARLFLSGDNAKLMKKIYKIYEKNAINVEDAAARVSGFTRVLHLEPRSNDGARQSILELVDYPVLHNTSADGTSDLYRGNIKLWLLIKTILYDEANSQPHTELTLKNLNKISLYKKQEDFTKEIKSIRSILLRELYSDKEMNLEKESEIIDDLVHSIYNYKKSQPVTRPGFEVMETRPERS